MKKLLLLAFLSLLLIIGSGISYLNKLILNEALLGTVSNIDIIPSKITFFYIKHFRRIHITKNELHPLHFILNGCYEEIPNNKKCLATIDLILDNSNLSIDDNSNDRLGLTPLHGACFTLF